MDAARRRAYPLWLEELEPRILPSTIAITPDAAPPAAVVSTDPGTPSPAPAAAGPMVFRSQTAEWFQRQGDGGGEAFQFGQANDVPISGDFDGDGKADFALFRPRTAQWFIHTSGGKTMTIQFGEPGLDRPIPADYDGDGKTDIAVFRPSTAEWFIYGSSSGPHAYQYGQVGDSIPVPGDYDSVGHAELSVYQSYVGTWFVAGEHPRAVRFSEPPGIVLGGIYAPVPGDYDGVGHDEPALYSPMTGQWLIMSSPTTGRVVQLGTPESDRPVPADYDGDGKTDIAVFDDSTMTWRIQASRAGYEEFHWGEWQDTPTTSSYQTRDWRGWFSALYPDQGIPGVDKDPQDDPLWQFGSSPSWTFGVMRFEDVPIPIDEGPTGPAYLEQTESSPVFHDEGAITTVPKYSPPVLPPVPMGSDSQTSTGCTCWTPTPVVIPDEDWVEYDSGRMGPDLLDPVPVALPVGQGCGAPSSGGDPNSDPVAIDEGTTLPITFTDYGDAGIPFTDEGPITNVPQETTSGSGGNAPVPVQTGCSCTCHGQPTGDPVAIDLGDNGPAYIVEPAGSGPTFTDLGSFTVFPLPPGQTSGAGTTAAAQAVAPPSGGASATSMNSAIASIPSGSSAGVPVGMIAHARGATSLASLGDTANVDGASPLFTIPPAGAASASAAPGPEIVTLAAPTHKRRSTTGAAGPLNTGSTADAQNVDEPSLAGSPGSN